MSSSRRGRSRPEAARAARLAPRGQSRRSSRPRPAPWAEQTQRWAKARGPPWGGGSLRRYGRPAGKRPVSGTSATHANKRRGCKYAQHAGAQARRPCEPPGCRRHQAAERGASLLPGDGGTSLESKTRHATSPLPTALRQRRTPPWSARPWLSSRRPEQPGSRFP